MKSSGMVDNTVKFTFRFKFFIEFSIYIVKYKWLLAHHYYLIKTIDILKKDDIVLSSTDTKHIFKLYTSYRTNTSTFWAVKERGTVGCLVDCFQAKLLTIRAVKIGFIVGLPVAPCTHEKILTMFNGFAKPAQHTAW